MIKYDLIMSVNVSELGTSVAELPWVEARRSALARLKQILRFLLCLSCFACPACAVLAQAAYLNHPEST